MESCHYMSPFDAASVECHLEPVRFPTVVCLALQNIFAIDLETHSK